MVTQQLLLLCGVIAGPLFIIVFLIEGALRPDYHPLRQPVSTLAMGKRGWIQRTNFIVTGILMFVCAFGLSSALVFYGGSFWGPFLIGVYGIGLICAGIFVTDMTGVEKVRSKALERGIQGRLHDISALFVFPVLFAACFVFCRLFAVSGAYGFAIYSALTGILFGVGFILSAVGFNANGKLSSIGGLLQRITIAIGWIWIALVAAYLIK